MIEQLSPSLVVAREAFDDRVDADCFPEELAVVADAVPRRRREFATVRGCARDALRAMGVEPAAIVPGAGGAPTWPVGVVGSMTHCAGYRAAMLARASEVEAVGIDAEPDVPLPREMLAAVALPEDLAHLPPIRALGVAADRLLFSAKEAVFKSCYPRTRRWLGCHDVAVALHPDGTFTARVLVGGPDGTWVGGRWLAAHGLVLTAVVRAAGGTS